MRDINGEIEYKEKKYKLVFNLNVLEKIQEEYGSLDKWGELTEGKNGGEPNAKAIIYGFTQMLNEGIDIDNEDNGTDVKPLTVKQVGRMITEVGLADATNKLHETVEASTQSTEKNA